MLNIIKADLYRIFRGKAFYITFGVLIAFIVLTSIAGSGNIGVNIQSVDTDTLENAVNELTAITKADGMKAPFINAEYTANLVYFLLPLIICFAGTDFSSGSVKNVLSRGISRTKYYFAKLIPVLFFTLIIQLINLVLPILIATVRHGFGSGFTMNWLADVLKVYGTQTLLLLAVACVGIFIVFLTKKTASINALFIGFMLVPTMVFYLLGLISSSLEDAIYLDVATNLILMANSSQLPTGDIVRALLLGVIYIAASIVAGILIFKKSDIK